MYRFGSVKAAPENEPEGPPGGGNTILVVSKKTGLGMETLRAWERRHGFPKPERRPGSNRRLYSDADLTRLLAIRRAMSAGYRVGDLIDKPVAQLELLSSEASSESSSPDLRRPSAAVAPLAALAPAPETLLELLKTDQVAALEDALRSAATLLGPRRFVTELAHPFTLAVGQAWADGEISIRHEHLATECLTTRLRSLIATYQDLEGAPLVLLATLPGEPHTLGLQMVAVMLAVKGARSRLLGASTPVDELVEAATSLGASAVGLTVTPASDLKVARRDVRKLRAGLSPEVALWLGGAGVAGLGRLPPGAVPVTSWGVLDQVVTAAR